MLGWRFRNRQAESRSIGGQCAIKQAAEAVIERLEERRLLSGSAGAEQDYLARMANFELSPAEMAAQSLDLVQWQGQPMYAKQSEWIVGLDLSSQPNATAKSLIENTGIGAVVKRTLGGENVALVQLPAGCGYAQLAASLGRLGVFRYAEPNGIVVGQRTPDDPYYAGSQWSLNDTNDHDIDAPEAWNITTGSSDVIVGVLDTGVDYTHPDLAANIWTNPGEIPGDGIDNDGNGYIDDVHGYDFAYDDGDPSDVFEHGTHVAGTIAAATNNTTGIAGVCWNAKIMAIKVLDDEGSDVPTGTWASAVAGINYATMMRTRGVNIRVTNSSWGWYYTQAQAPRSLYDAIAANEAAGMLFVAAAGNTKPGFPGRNNDDLTEDDIAYPATFARDNGPTMPALGNIISVAATDSADTLASFSHYGTTSVQIAAPGVGIVSTVPGNGYAEGDGTSMAAPHVTGVAALGWSYTPNARYQTIKAAILNGADQLASLDGYVNGSRRLNAYGTLLHLAPLTYTGTASAENIQVRINGANMEIVVDGTVRTSAATTSVGSIVINAGGGNDTITVGSDIIIPATLNGGDGNDSITGGSGDDSINGEAGADIIWGGAGNDTLYGGSGNDSIHGGDNNDLLYGEAGDDDLYGDAGNDTYFFSGTGLGADLVSEAANVDTDTLDFTGLSEGITLYLGVMGDRGGSAALSNTSLTLYLSGNALGIENVKGTIYPDAIYGNSRPNALWGNEGNDTLAGNGGDDTLYGEGGDDELRGDLGNDTYVFGSRSGGLGTDLIIEPINLESDTLDFSAFPSAVNVNLANANPTPAVLSASLVLLLSSDVAVENVRGTVFADTITGNGRPNYLWGNNGNDTISAGAGADTLEGGRGDDSLIGGTGGDTYVYAGSDLTDTGEWIVEDANADIDTLDFSGYFNDYGTGVSVSLPSGSVSGSGLVVYLLNSSGWSESEGIENIKGSAYDDSIYANSRPNTFWGNAGNDTFFAEWVAVAGAGDTFWGGTGNDTISYYSRWIGVTVTLDGVANDGESGEGDNVQSDIETVKGGSGNDSLVGTNGAQEFWGSDGNDTIVGGGGADTIRGEGGNDRLYSNIDAYGGYTGDSAGDLIEGGDGDDTIHGSTGQDTIYGDNRDWGGNGNDVIYGEDNADTIYGQGGNDTIYGDRGDAYGSYGNDYIDGGDGDDSIQGGQGSDTIHGGGGDNVIYGDAPNPASGDGNDVIYAEGAANCVYGGAGNDLITSDCDYGLFFGGTGNDTIYGSNGNDVIAGMEGDDYLDGGGGNDTIWGDGYGSVSDGNDVIIGGGGDDYLYGGGGNDTLDGGGGTDSIYGDAGDDLVRSLADGDYDCAYGGSGTDTIEGSDAFDGVDEFEVFG